MAQELMVIDVKDGWEKCELQNYINLIDYRGRTPKKTESGVRLITAKNVKLGFLQKHPEEFIATENYEEWMSRGIPNYGDVIFTTEAPLANVAQLNTYDKVAFAQRTIVMQPDPKKINQTYLKYLLLSPKIREDIFSNGTGATVTGIKSKLLKKIIIPIPSLNEQHQIVDILDKAFTAIATAKANAEQNLINAKELFESYLQNVFENKGDDWEEKTLGELCLKDRGITYGVIKLGKEVINGTPCLRTSNVRWLKIETKGVKYIDNNLSKDYSRTILQGREVLVNVRGTLGGIAVVPNEMIGWNVSREVAVVPVNHNIVHPFYLSYLIGSPISQNWLGSVKKGAAYVGINLKDLRLFVASYPKMLEQKFIVKKLDALSKECKILEDIYTKKITDLDELKKSILQKAFNGEL